MCDDVSEALDRASVWCILPKRNMRTPPIIIGGEFRNNSPQVLFVAWPWLSSSESPAVLVNSYSARCPPIWAHKTSKMTPEKQQERVRSSFAKQELMTTLGATLSSVSPGMVEIALSPHPAISQQHGFVHAGAVTAIADSAAGYAALTLMPADTGVLTTEFKINLLAPAAGERILARGRVVKAGRTLTLAQAEVFANTGGQEKLIALLTATLMAVEGRDGISD